MRMAYYLRNRQHRRSWHPFVVERRQRCIPIRQGLQPTFDSLDQNLFVSETLTDRAKPRVICQFGLSHCSRQPSPLMVESRDNSDISLRRPEDAAGNKPGVM